VGVVVARRALPALQQTLDAARANWAQADARFRAGLGTAVELADAEAVLADAEVQLALGTFDVARTRAVFGRAIAEAI
jgi:outer membrane protein TolC